MELRNALLQEHSKNQTDKIIRWVGSNKTRIAELVALMMHDEYRVVQRAAWAVSGVAAEHPDLMLPHLPSLVKQLGNKEAPVAVKRNVFRLLQFVELPEAIHSDLMNNGFEALIDPKEALAVRAFAMTVMARLALIYPEINNELKVVLEDALRHEQAPSFKSRGKKILQQIERSTG